jgi:hypothetical protein
VTTVRGASHCKRRLLSADNSRLLLQHQFLPMVVPASEIRPGVQSRDRHPSGKRTRRQIGGEKMTKVLRSTSGGPEKAVQPEHAALPETWGRDGERSNAAVRALARRLEHGDGDMGQAARGAALLAELCRTNGRAQSDGETALITGVVLAYARPFTRRDDVGGLDADEWTPTGVRQASLHRMLIASRNDRLTDTTTRSGDSSDASGFPASVSARKWERISELAAGQKRRMRA